MGDFGTTVDEQRTMAAIQSINQKLPDIKLRDLFAMNALNGILTSPDFCITTRNFWRVVNHLAQHEAELAAYRAAKAAMNDLLGGAKLPKMDTLKKERRELSEKKKALYAEYRKAQADMRQAVAVKANIDYLLGHTDGRENKAQER